MFIVDKPYFDIQNLTDLQHNVHNKLKVAYNNYNKLHVKE